MTQQQLPPVESTPVAYEWRPTPETLVHLVATTYQVSEDLAGKWLRDAFENLPF